LARFWQKACVQISTIGYLGKLPAPGLFGSLAGMFFFRVFEPNLLVFAILLIASYFIINISLNHFKTKDPNDIILDEFVGIVLVFLILPTLTLKNSFAVLFLFRAFDIKKPWLIGLSEKLPNAFGIITDDLLAGLAATVTVKLLIKIGLIIL